MATTRARRLSRRAVKARNETIQTIGLTVGAIVALPAVAMFAVLFGSVMSKNDALFNAIVNLFA